MDVLGRSVARSFSTLSRIRGTRIFHPKGVGFEAVLTPGSDPGGVPLALFEGGPREAVVRLSRSVGLPEWCPDPCGLGIRILDAYGDGRHQDFLLVSSGEAPVRRHLLLPSRGFLNHPYSSLLPYRADGRQILIGARATSSDLPNLTLSELARREEAGIGFELRIAQLRGDWQQAASLGLGARLPDEEIEDLRLNPANTGPDLELAWALNRLRDAAYRGSQEGRARA